MEMAGGRAYIPANASGLVSSSTRWPASRPSPSTCMTTKSSDVMWTFARASGSMRCSTGTNSSVASAREHTTEHSIGVTEMLRKSCSEGEGVVGGCTAPFEALCAAAWLAALGRRRSRTDWRKLWYRFSGMWMRARRVSLEALVVSRARRRGGVVVLGPCHAPQPKKKEEKIERTRN